MKFFKRSLRTRIFFSMIFLVLGASILIAGVTIIQYKDEAVAYQKDKLKRKEASIRAMEMIMTAGMIDANQALQYNLVNHVTPLEDLIDLAEKLAGKIMRNSMVAIAQAIEAINANYEDGVNGFEQEIEGFGKSFGTEDFKEGTSAFLEKRKADFPGE